MYPCFSILEVDEATGDGIIILPDPVIKQLDLKEGQSIIWSILDDKSIVISKKIANPWDQS